MHDQQTKRQSQARQNAYQELYESLGKSRRLKASDKPIFAKNLGALAAKLCPENPRKGAKDIVKHAGYESLWPTKRKKFFRLPGEEAPPAGKDGDYASNPIQFRKLAESAGELLCKGNSPEAIEYEKEKAIKRLAEGSDFMPSFIPAGKAGQSAKDLLEEYASTLCAAIKSRTKISELWEILQSTQISIQANPDNPSRYGDAARLPQSLLADLYRASVKAAHFVPAQSWGSDEWARPTLAIGQIAFPVRIRMFCIPAAQGHLFACKLPDPQLPSEALEWLQSVGFDLDGRKFPDLCVSQERLGWQDTDASILLNVGLKITHFGDAEPKLLISVWGDLDYVAHIDGYDGPTVQANIATQIANPRMTQHYGLEVDEMDYLEVVYERPFDPSTEESPIAIGILPSCWQLGSNSIEWTAPGVCLDQASSDVCNEMDANGGYALGWTEERFIAKLLMSADCEFYPINPESDPVGGILPAGSIGASLLQNVRSASPTNRITQLLIDKVALTADAGLRFYEAMVDDARSAIHQI
jgi:hypothetical protein